MSRKQRTSSRKKQLRINRKIKIKLYRDIFIHPCIYCKYVFTYSQLTIEHLIPLSDGGSNEPSNIALACAACNHSKGKESWMLKKQIMKEKYHEYSHA